MNTSQLLTAHQLSKCFVHEGKQVEVLKGLDLVIHPGDRIAVIGSSGAGKSTLLHVLGTLDRPTSGSLHFQGQDLLALNNRALAAFRSQSIGFMFQFHHLLPEFSALENVMMPALIRRVPKRVARAEAAQWLESVGLEHRLSHRPGELSGGEQQRVALARALMGKPALVLADEPTGNLDQATSEGIHDLFEAINTEHGTALLVVTHDPNLARRMPRRLRMSDGRLVDAEEAAP